MNDLLSQSALLLILLIEMSLGLLLILWVSFHVASSNKRTPTEGELLSVVKEQIKALQEQIKVLQEQHKATTMIAGSAQQQIDRFLNFFFEADPKLLEYLSRRSAKEKHDIIKSAVAKDMRDHEDS